MSIHNQIIKTKILVIHYYFKSKGKNNKLSFTTIIKSKFSFYTKKQMFRMKNKILLFCICSLFCISCTERKAYGKDSVKIEINRFDKDLFEYLKGEKSQKELLDKYPVFIDLYGEKIIGIGKRDSTGFFDRLNKFFQEPTLLKLYKDEIQLFDNFGDISNTLSDGFSILKTKFPSIKIPSVYMHVSGLSQNIVVADSILSVSADKYIGSDYPLYQDYFYDYQKQNMIPQRIVPDYFLGFLMSEFPPKDNEATLLDKMLYEGKLRYILSVILPESPDSLIIGYTKKQYEWCQANELQIWKAIIGQKQLYSQDQVNVSKYLQDAPFTSTLTSESPGRVGIWVGYRIVCSYMKENPTTSLQELINSNDSQEFLKKSKYKP